MTRFLVITLVLALASPAMADDGISASEGAGMAGVLAVVLGGGARHPHVKRRHSVQAPRHKRKKG